jgi:hypothetical protein
MKVHRIISIGLILLAAIINDACVDRINLFTQLTGPPGNMYGIFWATGMTSNSIFITRRDVPNPNFIPELQIVVNREPPDECIDQFPGSSDTRPLYWND